MSPAGFLGEGRTLSIGKRHPPIVRNFREVRKYADRRDLSQPGGS
jgi:hypothetical protein